MPNQEKTTPKAKCMRSYCENPVWARGCCKKHYNSLARQVRSGLVSWPALTGAGFCKAK